MSMLYGYVNLNHQVNDIAMLNNMYSKLADYKYDSHTTLSENNVAMGYLNQFVTVESKFDDLPYYDKSAGLYFVCDAIIDNRDELINSLALESKKDLPDSQIVFESYKKWGKDCAQHLLGDFAFVVYDEKAKQVEMFRDHMGKRLLYYRVENNQVFFSTLIKPLINPFEKQEKIVLNEQYLVEFLSLKGIRHEITPGHTIFQSIDYVLPASCLTVSVKSVLNQIYWDPTKIKTDKKLAQTDYINEFKRIFNEAVKCRLRTTGDVGVFLSGGLDSGSVACVAASILDGQNKKLNTYTSVPRTGFKSSSPPFYVVDESKSVKKMHDSYPNMNLHFVDSKEKNSLNVIDRILHSFEQPYKFVENSYWLDDILQIAGNDGCKVILSGFLGNSTISYGSYKTHFYEHFIRLRLISFVKDFQSFCHHNKLSRKKMSSNLTKEIIRSVFYLKRESNSAELVRNTYRKKYCVEKKLHSFGFMNKPILRVREERSLFFHPTVTNHVSSTITKLSIANNICERDPTCDKRVVEFCLKLPYTCFFDKERGQDRGLVRQAMRGIVPSEILNNKHYGLQAADWFNRIDDQWEDFFVTFNEKLYKSNYLLEYIDLDYMADLVTKYSKITYSEDISKHIREIIMIFICNQFTDMLLFQKGGDYMKKEWKEPEVSCLSIKETEHRFEGEGRDGPFISTPDGKIFGTSTGDSAWPYDDPVVPAP